MGCISNSGRQLKSTMPEITTSFNRLPRHSETARDKNSGEYRKSKDDTKGQTQQTKSKGENDFEETVTMVSSQFSNAMNQIASIAFDLFGERATVPDLNQTAITTESSDDSVDLPQAESIGTQSFTSNESAPPPPVILDMRQASKSSAFSCVRPVALSPTGSSSQTSPPTSKHPIPFFQGSAALCSTPMARMRSGEVPDASFLPLNTLSPPRVTGEQAIQDKHAKWRRQIQRAKQKEEENKKLKRQLQKEGGCNIANSQTVSLKLLEQLFQSANCGKVPDDLVSPEDTFVTTQSYSSDPHNAAVLAGNPSITTPVRQRSKLTSPTIRGPEEPPSSERDRMDSVVNEQTSSSQAESQLISTVSLTDKNFIKAFTHEAVHEGIPMIFHDVSDSDPYQVMVFIEVGVLNGDGNYAGPKLAWYSREGETKNAIDLLDIQSLEKATPIQLQEYPFAIPGNSLILRFQNMAGVDLVLESSNEQEAMRFIHGVQWVVARMTFNLIVGNPLITCELLDVAPSLDKSAKAMNDVTNQMIEKSLFQHQRKIV